MLLLKYLTIGIKIIYYPLERMTTTTSKWLIWYFMQNAAKYVSTINKNKKADFLPIPIFLMLCYRAWPWLDKPCYRVMGRTDKFIGSTPIESSCCNLVMTRYQGLNFDTISIRYWPNIAISIRYRYFVTISIFCKCVRYASARTLTRHEQGSMFYLDNKMCVWVTRSQSISIFIVKTELTERSRVTIKLEKDKLWKMKDKNQ